MGDNIFRRDASVAEAFYLFYLRGTQACCISKKFIDGCVPFLKCLPHNIHLHYGVFVISCKRSATHSLPRTGYGGIQYLIKFWISAFTNGGYANASLNLSTTFYLD